MIIGNNVWRCGGRNVTLLSSSSLNVKSTPRALSPFGIAAAPTTTEMKMVPARKRLQNPKVGDVFCLHPFPFSPIGTAASSLGLLSFRNFFTSASNEEKGGGEGKGSGGGGGAAAQGEANEWKKTGAKLIVVGSFVIAAKHFVANFTFRVIGEFLKSDIGALVANVIGALFIVVGAALLFI